MHNTIRISAAVALVFIVYGSAGIARMAHAANGQMTWAVHVTIAPRWLDPADTETAITPFMVLYALHDALVKPMPKGQTTPSLAESWTASPDWKTYDFVLRNGIKFHNGDPVTAEDVKFSFERYRGGAAKLLKDRVKDVQVVDARHVRFVMKDSWPDFMTFYGTTASGAGWIVPKKYVEKVGDDGFTKAPIGAGPYRFVSLTPGVELVLEAFDGYWRKPPNVKRLVMKVIPDEATRLAALKRGEIDIAYSIRAELAEELRRTPGLSLKPVVAQAPNWIYFPDQWDPKSPWHDLRVRQAANLALDRDGINEALFLGYCKITNSIIPDSFDFYWQPPPAVYDPAKAKKFLAEAGYPNGFDAGLFHCDSSYSNMGEAAVDSLQQVGIRTRLEPIERAGFIAAYSGKKLSRGILRGASAAFGNAATRLASFVVKGGAYVYGSSPDIDELYTQQANEIDRSKRAAILNDMQRLVYEKAIYAPVWQLAFINGVGPRVGQSAFGLIPGFTYTAPFEDITIAGT